MHERCSRIDRSSYRDTYKFREEELGMAVYWIKKNIGGKDKEQWARLRCGNVRNTRGIGVKECRLCVRERERERKSEREGGRERMMHVWSYVAFERKVIGRPRGLGE